MPVAAWVEWWPVLALGKWMAMLVAVVVAMAVIVCVDVVRNFRDNISVTALTRNMLCISFLFTSTSCITCHVSAVLFSLLGS